MLRVPETLPEDGILVGYSLEHEHRKTPVGFSFGDADKTPETGYLDPILYTAGGHLMTVAPTEAGKGTGCIIPTLLRYRGQMIVIDPKGENYAVTARRREELGQRVALLDPFRLFPDSPHRASLNPLDILCLDSANATDNAAMLARFFTPVGLSQDPFWDDAAASILTGLILHYCEVEPAALASMTRIRNDLLEYGHEGAANREDPIEAMRNGMFELFRALLTTPQPGGGVATADHKPRSADLAALFDKYYDRHMFSDDLGDPDTDPQVVAFRKAWNLYNDLSERIQSAANSPAFPDPVEQTLQYPRAIERLRCSSNDEARRFGSFAFSSPDKTWGSILTTLSQHLAWAKGKAIEAATSTTSIDLRGLIDGAPMTIYIVLPPDKLESHARLLRAWVGTLMKAIMLRRNLPERKTLFVLDEAAQLGRLAEFKAAVTLLRGYGLQTWSFWQDLSQLKGLYPDCWETIVNNCKVIQSFGIANMLMARTIEDLVGFGSQYALMDLDADELVLAVAGDEPVIAQRPNYLTDPAFAFCFHHNPYFSDDDADELRPRLPQRVFARKTTATHP